MAGGRDAWIWHGVDRVVDAAESIDAIRSHRLEPFAARRRRALGQEVPRALAEGERAGVMLSLTAPVLLERVRELTDEPLLVFKGPEIAARYPDPALRTYRDLDLLLHDARGLEQKLLAAGWVHHGDPEFYEDGPHRAPLVHPDLPLLLELHTHPNWPRWLEAPHADELLAGAIPAADVPGIVAPPPAQHAVLVAIHSWTHGPVAKLRDLVDVAAVASEATEDELREVARRWGAERLWDTTWRLATSVLRGDPPPAALRLWARNLREVRERTVAETHAGRWLSPFSALAPVPAARASAIELAASVRPKSDETWGTKLRRTRRALRNALAAKSAHDSSIDPTTEGGARLPARGRVIRSEEQAGDEDRHDRDDEHQGRERGEP
jgi:hypothetical protein